MTPGLNRSVPLERQSDWAASLRVVCFLAVLPVTGALFGNAETAAIELLRVEPGEIVLEGTNRRQQVIVTGLTAAGQARDLTHAATLESSDESVARIDGSRVVGVADGTAELKISFDDLCSTMRVRVVRFDDYPPVHFSRDVIPILTKAGCNGGGCHGKATGQNGFKLSVFGFDPPGDYEALVRHSRGRRVSAASPDRSLLLLKATARTPHGGGQRLEFASQEYEVVQEWMRQGLPFDTDDEISLTTVEVSPTNRVLGFEAQQQLRATAIYSDNSRRDVTGTAIYTSNAATIADADERGIVRTGNRPGEAAITISYMGHVAVTLIQVPRPDRPREFPELPVLNHVDELVWQKLKTMGIVPSGVTSDAVFLRRALLDLTGSLPAPEEARAFLADTTAKKRQRLIEDLFERDGFVEYWTLKWADILLIDSDQLGERGAYEFHRWLRRQIVRNRPYNEWVRDLITATGNSAKYGPVNFFRATETPEDAARSVSQAFLGVRLECAQCHHHPFDKWSREDFYGLVGFFNGLERKSLQDGRQLVYHAGYRETRIPFSEQIVPTRVLTAEAPKTIQRGDPRVVLADWVTASDNPWFARLAANRLWKHFMGRGLVEPEDDLRATNPPTNEALLDFLAEELVSSGFDLRHLIRVITQSRVYQLSSIANDSNREDRQSFSRYFAKRLSAEVMLDAICQVTGVAEHFPGRPVGTRAIQLWDNRMPSYFLEIFGRPDRRSVCECGRTSDPTMAQALHLMNAPEIEAKISHPEGRVARLIAQGMSDEEVVTELCLAALGRPPGAKERKVAALLFDSAPRKEAAEDFLWSLLNSYEFLFVN